MELCHFILGLTILHVTAAMHLRGRGSALPRPAPPPPPGADGDGYGAVTDIPEEREIGEDVTPSANGIIQPTPAEDPVEQHDLSPSAGAQPKRGRNSHTGHGQTFSHHPRPTTGHTKQEDRVLALVTLVQLIWGELKKSLRLKV